MSNNDKKIEELYSFMDEVTKRLEKLISQNEPEKSTYNIRGKYCSAYYCRSNTSKPWRVELHKQNMPKNAKILRGLFSDRSDAENLVNDIDQSLSYLLEEPTHTNQKS